MGIREEVLASPGTHFIVRDILELIKDKDPVDNLKNLELIKRIIKSELEGG